MSNQNNATELRSILFDTLRDLRNKNEPMDIERAKTISDVARTAISLAKTEVDHMKVTGQTTDSGFLPAPIEATSNGTRTVPAPPEKPSIAGQLITANVTKHRCA